MSVSIHNVLIERVCCAEIFRSPSPPLNGVTILTRESIKMALAAKQLELITHKLFVENPVPLCSLFQGKLVCQDKSCSSTPAFSMHLPYWGYHSAIDLTFTLSDKKPIQLVRVDTCLVSGPDNAAVNS